MSSTSNSSSSGSRWAKTKTKTFLECHGQNLFRTVEKRWKNQSVWSQQSSKKIKNATLWPFSPSWGNWPIYAVGKGILEDKILKILSLSQLSVTVHVQVLVGSSFDPNSGFSHLSPQRFCQGYFSDGSGSRVSLLCSFIMVNSVCVSKMMRHQILLVIYISRSQPWL